MIRWSPTSLLFFDFVLHIHGKLAGVNSVAGEPCGIRGQGRHLHVAEHQFDFRVGFGVKGVQCPVNLGQTVLIHAAV